MSALRGIRVHLSGSLPDEASPSETAAFDKLVRQLTASILRDGGIVVHGSHPSLVPALRAAAVPFIDAGGSRDALVLVRANSFAVTEAQLQEIDEQRAYANVEIVPASHGNFNESL